MATFDEDLAAAKASGLPFRVVVDLTAGPSVAYLTAGEIADAQARAASETAARNTPEAVRKATDETERAACALDQQILPLVNQTKAEWNTWAGANFPSLTAAERTRLGMLFWVVAVGVRRAIRNGA